jgi:hypothetical protein
MHDTQPTHLLNNISTNNSIMYKLNISLLTQTIQAPWPESPSELHQPTF